jgi:hypothetical protein
MVGVPVGGATGGDKSLRDASRERVRTNFFFTMIQFQGSDSAQNMTGVF